jgi:hypothetical protein
MSTPVIQASTLKTFATISSPVLLSLLVIMSTSRQLIVIDIYFILAITVGISVGIISYLASERLNTLILFCLLLLFIDVFGMQNLLNSLNSMEPTLRTISKIGILGAMLGLSFLVVFILREHFAEIFFTTVLVVTVIVTVDNLTTMPVSIGDTSRIVSDIDSEATAEARDQTLPIRLHIMLDSHMAPIAMPIEWPDGERISQFLKEFYSRHGFHLFARSYSQYRWTRKAMAAALNFHTKAVDPEQYYIGRSIGEDSALGISRRMAGAVFRVYKLDKSKYFEQIRDQGYSLSVAAQTGYLNFCTAARMTKCRTLVGTRKTRYPNHMILYNIFDRFKRLTGNKWEVDRTSFYMKIHEIADEAIADMSKAKRGEMIFAHIYSPHHPNLMDENCKFLATNEQGMDAYIQDMLCVYKKLDKLFLSLKKNKLFKDAEILIHGDHGVRSLNRQITRKDVADPGSIDPKKIVQTYSALFAIKAPDVKPGYDERSVSIQQLMIEYFGTDQPSPTADGNDVFFEGVTLTMPQTWN